MYNNFVKNFLIILLAIILSGCAYTPNNYTDWRAMVMEKGYPYTAAAAPEENIKNGYWAASAKSQQEQLLQQVKHQLKHKEV